MPTIAPPGSICPDSYPSDRDHFVAPSIGTDSYSAATILTEDGSTAVWRFNPSATGWISVRAENLVDADVWASVDGIPYGPEARTWNYYEPSGAVRLIIRVIAGESFFITVEGESGVRNAVRLLVGNMVTNPVAGEVAREEEETEGSVGPSGLGMDASWGYPTSMIQYGHDFRAENGYFSPPPADAHGSLLTAILGNRQYFQEVAGDGAFDSGDFRKYFPQQNNGGYEGSQLAKATSGYGLPYGADEVVGVYDTRPTGRPLGYPIPSGDRDTVFHLGGDDSFVPSVDFDTPGVISERGVVSVGGSTFNDYSVSMTWYSETVPSRWVSDPGGSPIYEYSDSFLWYSRKDPAGTHGFPLLAYPYNSATIASIAAPWVDLDGLVSTFGIDPPWSGDRPFMPGSESVLSGFSFRFFDQTHDSPTRHSGVPLSQSVDHGTVRMYLVPRIKKERVDSPGEYVFTIGPLTGNTVDSVGEFIGTYTCHSGQGWIDLTNEQVAWATEQEHGFALMLVPEEISTPPSDQFSFQFAGDLAVQATVHNPEWRYMVPPDLPEVPTSSIQGELDGQRARFKAI